MNAKLWIGLSSAGLLALICFCLGQGPKESKPAAPAAERMDVDALIAKLDSGEIGPGWDFNAGLLPKPNVVDVSYQDAMQKLYGVYGVSKGSGVILLYVNDGSVYAACAYGLSADWQERWWFADTAPFAQHVELSKQHKPRIYPRK